MRKREKAPVSPRFLTGKQLELTRDVEAAVSVWGGSGGGEASDEFRFRQASSEWFGTPG